MHIKAKQRIKEANSKKDTRPVLVLPKEGNIYNNFKDGIDKLCDQVLESDITSEQKEKVAWIKSRININL